MKMKSALPESLARSLQHSLSGESRIWTGHPDAGRIFRRSLGSWIFAIPWTTFSLAWTSAPLSVLLFAKGPDNMGGWGRPVMALAALFGVPFIAIGLYMLYQPFSLASQARRTVVALTERRLVILTAGRTTEVRSIPLDRIVTHALRLRRNGTGDMTLKLGARRDSEGDLVEIEETLIGVENAQALDRELRTAIARRG